MNSHLYPRATCLECLVVGFIDEMTDHPHADGHYLCSSCTVDPDRDYTPCRCCGVIPKRGEHLELIVSGGMYICWPCVLRVERAMSLWQQAYLPGVRRCIVTDGVTIEERRVG